MRPQAKVSKIAAAVRIALLASSPWLAAHAAPPLPQVCAGGSCGGMPFLGYGSASYAQSGTKGTVNQISTNAILNWQSFNIAQGYTMQFVQPSKNSVALNEIYDSNPSQIFGALNANGHVFLINQNGIIFGGGATVNVGGLVASTLPITSAAAVTTGSAQNYYGLVVPAAGGQPSFQQPANGGPSEPITVEQGATIESANGGQIYLFAPEVTNLGNIQTPAGQTILAAGTSVYLAASNDPSLRGVVVEVGGHGTVTNGLASNANISSPQQLVGQIAAQDGNISLAALAVNQYGRLNATTSVSENGSIYLQARNGTVSSTTTTSTGVTPEDDPGAGGTLTLGQNSDTEVNLDTSDPTTETDSVAQPSSTIIMSGATVDMLQGSVARATAGVIDVYADTTLSSLFNYLGTAHWDEGLSNLVDSSDGSRVYMAAGSVLDVSGANITLPVSDNVISADLQATELADSPLLRGGPLQGQTIDFDIRAHGTNADGSTWWGTPLANVTGEILALGRNVVERNLAGGTVNIQSQGDVILAPSSEVDVSGGYIQYTAGELDTSQLLTLWGQIVPVGSASPYTPYAGIVTSSTATDTKWGVTETYQTTPSYYSPGYVEGKDAGTLTLSAPNFVFDGTVSASTVAGPYQTQPTTPEPTTAAGWATSSWLEGSMYRPYNQVPAGATLVIGTPGGAGADLVVGSANIAPGEVLPGLQNADGSAFNPLSDPLPASFTASTLTPTILDEFQNVKIFADGKLTEEPGVSLSFAPGGSFTAQAASIDIEGGINVPSGAISLTTEPTFADQTNPSTELILGSAASLTAAGEWINDSTTLYPNGNSAPVYISGGSVSLMAASPGDQTATTSMELDPGSTIDVSGGAQLTSSGTLNAGAGGKITIDASTSSPGLVSLTGSPMPPTSLELGATLRAYGLYDDGSLSMGAAGVCIAASNCSGNDSTTVLWLTPQFLTSGGFATYNITADQDGLTLAPGLSLQLIQSNFELSSGYAMRPDATSLEGFSTVGILPLQFRKAVDLSLALYYPANLGINLNGTQSEFLSFASPLPSLVIPEGDVISTDPQGSISLASNTELDVEGVLRAPGGDISLTLGLAPSSSGTTITVAAYDSAEAIWLGPQAVLDASGADEIFPNKVGSPTGSVLPGGTVNLTAPLGSLELLPGSVIDVAGTSGTIDVVPVGGGLGEDERIASAGGTIKLSSSAGGVVGATLLAAAGPAGDGLNQPGGGSLYLTADAQELGQDIQDIGNGPITDYIVVSPTLVPTIVAPGSQIPAALQGQMLLPASTLQQGGFSLVALESYLGQIDFTGGVTLSAAQEVSLDSEEYSVEAGTTATVEAPYVEFGSSSTPYGTTPMSSGGDGVLPVSGGTGALDVSGSFIELYGTSSLVGVGTARFDSSGDLRVRGLQGNASFDPNQYISGGLYADGTIDLTAAQIYPSTLTQFVISADPQYAIPTNGTSLSSPASGSIAINGSQGANADLLSAGGSLTLAAASIAQDGVLRAPFGTIALDATSLTLGPGSLTSTSADGLTIPFGTTQGNTGGGGQNSYDWVYPLLESSGSYFNAVYGTAAGDLPPPSQHIALNGTNVDVQNGAVIDISGGGDLQAYEWVPGPNGTQDVLDCSDCYAIIPSLHANVAPYDPAIANSSNANPQVGEAVYLSAGSGVPAGTYLLMPARYALLPGAYLVTPMGAAYQDMQPGQSFKAPDGGAIVSGYLAEMGLPYGSSRLDGFEVTPASVFLNQAQYNLTTGNSFFSAQISVATANAADEAVSAMRLPEDGGVLDIVAGAFLTLDGSLRTSAESDARGAEVDISNPNIVVAANSSGVSQPGALVLTTSSLDQLGAQTLLLGGENDDGVIATVAQNVTILDGAALTAPQLLLTAQNQVSVESGASITASGAAPPAATLTLAGSGAFLGVSAGPQVTLTTTQSAEGTLNLAAGSSLTASHGSIYLDATAGINTGGSISVTDGSLAVQAPQIALGAAPSATGTAVLGQTILESGGLAGLLLTSSNPVAVYQGGSASAQNITIDAPGIVSALATGQSATISATGTTGAPGMLTLENDQGTSISSNGSQSGSLTLSASNVTLGIEAPATAGPTTGATAPSAFGIEGFSSTAIDAQSSLTAASDVNFSTDGNLSIATPVITTGAGATATFAATGSVALLPSSGTAAAVAATAALGGSLAITGSSIDLATEINVPSGAVTLTASGGSSGAGNLSIDAGGAVNVAGVDQQYGTTEVATPGGTVAFSATGDINLASGSAINVSAGQGGIAGSLSLSAPNGTILAAGTVTGTGAAQGGSFSVEAQSFGGGTDAGFGALSAEVEAGGFTGSQSYWLQGSPDAVLTVASGTTLKASTVLIEADQGAIDVYGTIDASSTSGGGGGNVTLSAANGIDLETGGAIEAQDTSPGANGGTVELDLGNSNPNATLTLSPGSTINVSGGGPATTSAGVATDANLALSGSGGNVLLRVPYTIAGNVAVASGAITGASSTVLEAYQNVPVTSDSSGNVDITDNSTFQPDATAIVAAVLPMVEQLNSVSGLSVLLEPGIELDATGNITLDTPWDLSTWRFQDASGAYDLPGILTLRAAGNVTFNQPLSDGFVDATSGTLMTPGSGSWSYRIVAGADLSAANPLAVTENANQPAATVTIGSLGSPTLVRTGNGFIKVAASGDFVLGDQDSVLYTAGVSDTADGAPPKPTCGGQACPPRGFTKLPPYAVDGGDININVAGDVDGSADTDQFVNDWLWRQGGQTEINLTAAQAPVAWSVQYADFEQGVGALAGGNVTVHAGGNINNFSASVASIGVATAGGSVDVKNGGTLSVSAGGSILGGSYYVGLGTATLSAGGSIGVGTGSSPSSATAPLIGLGEASVSITARGNVQVSDIVNPTMLDSGISQGSANAAEQNYFSTFGAASSATLVSVGGDVVLDQESSALGEQYSASFNQSNGSGWLSPSATSYTDQDGAAAMDLLPPVLAVYALDGDIDISRDATLFPSSQGNLQIFASGNVNIGSGTSYAADLVLPDADPSAMPSIANPSGTAQGNAEGLVALADITSEHDSTPLFGSVSAFDENPAQITALNGSITFSVLGPGAEVWSGKPVIMSAGEDVVDPNIYAQNLTAADVTSITAGGDIIYPQARTSAGVLEENGSSITVAGPGELQVAAGGNVDLGTSSGIVTRGNQDNPALTSSGASISIEAGVGASNATAAQYNAFIQQYIDGGSQFDGQLVSYVEQTTGQTGLTDSEAKQVFAGMTSQQQRTFVEQLFFYMLQTYGTEAAKSGNNADYAGAYAAIQTLFPGANASQSANDPFSAHGGNISLYFSQIYTEDGGDISLLAPGGGVDAGLSIPPTNFGLSKSPQQLGIVAERTGNVQSFSYGDFEVNASRVFAADGGNILVWSAEGNIDAGRGSKTSLSAASPSVTYDTQNGFATVNYYPPTTGSGIQALADTPGVSPGTVYLFAPHGVVNANEAGIVAGNLVVGAVSVLGTNNIQVSGVTIGVPTVATGLGALALSGSTAAAGATNSAQSSLAQNNQQQQQQAPRAAAELRWLDVFVLGFGEQTCSATDIECLKRQKHTTH